MLDQRGLRSVPSYPVAYRKSHSFRNLRRETRLNSHQKVRLGKDDVAPVERTKVARWPLCRLGGSQESQNGIGGFCILELGLHRIGNFFQLCFELRRLADKVFELATLERFIGCRHVLVFAHTGSTDHVGQFVQGKL